MHSFTLPTAHPCALPHTHVAALSTGPPAVHACSVDPSKRLAHLLTYIKGYVGTVPLC